MQFPGGRFLQITTRLLVWLLMGETRSAAAQEEVRAVLLRMCGPEGAEAPFGWFYREYCVAWIRDVGGVWGR